MRERDIDKELHFAIQAMDSGIVSRSGARVSPTVRVLKESAASGWKSFYMIGAEE
jgi:hypothetical protein